VALSFECDDCGRHWPNTREYALCPECRNRCRTSVTSTVMTPGEAQAALREIKFVRFCNQRDQKRERLGHPSPEEIGRQEAEAIIQQAREIHALPEK
jgi:hypothetical protein